MSFEVAVETRYGERLLLWHSNRLPGGKAIVAFLNALMRYCSGDQLEDETDTQIKQWFARIELLSGQSICELVEPLQSCCYHGFWDYKEDEYERYLLNPRDTQLSEEAFQQTLRFVDSRWVPVQEMLNMLETLLDLLRRAEPDGNWWYHPAHTLEDFVILKKTLEIAARAGRETEVRIQFF